MEQTGDSPAAKYWVVIPAAGVGSRMNSDKPKQYLELNGKKLIEHSLETIMSHPKIQGAVVSLAADDRCWDSVKLPQGKSIRAVIGGAERCQSVLNALEKLSDKADEQDWVLVHDAARPCVRVEDIDKLMQQVGDTQAGGILGVPVRDTMKRSGEGNEILETVDRCGLWHAQTPQMFRLKMLSDALQMAIKQQLMVTDESSAMELFGVQPILVEGHSDNIKVTRPEDLNLASFYLNKKR